MSPEQPEVLSRPGHEALNNWFCLSYASFAVMPRVLMEAMPDKWQLRMARLLTEFDHEFNQPDTISSRVQITDDQGRLVKTPKWLVNYRHPDSRLIESMRRARTTARPSEEEGWNGIK